MKIQYLLHKNSDLNFGKRLNQCIKIKDKRGHQNK